MMIAILDLQTRCPFTSASPVNTKSKLCYSDCTHSEPRLDRDSLLRFGALVELLVLLVLLQLLQKVSEVSEREGFKLCERGLQLGVPQVRGAHKLRVNQPHQDQELQLTKKGNHVEDRGQPALNDQDERDQDPVSCPLYKSVLVGLRAYDLSRLNSRVSVLHAKQNHVEERQHRRAAGVRSNCVSVNL